MRGQSNILLQVMVEILGCDYEYHGRTETSKEVNQMQFHLTHKRGNANLNDF